MTDRRPLFMGAWFVAMLLGVTVPPTVATVAASTSKTPAVALPDRAFDLDARLEALDPARPIEYLELAEEIAEGLESGGSPDRTLARRLYGLAGRLDPDGLAASAALGIASLATDPRTRDRYRAAASLLDPDAVRDNGTARPEVDAATAMEISEAFGEFRSGRAIGLLRILQDPARVRLLRSWDEALPGGVDWLSRQVEAQGRGRPALSRGDALAMIRVELALLDRGRPDWSTLLDDESAARPRYRNGAWVE